MPKIYDEHAFLTLKIADILHHFERRSWVPFFGGPNSLVPATHVYALERQRFVPMPDRSATKDIQRK